MAPTAHQAACRAPTLELRSAFPAATMGRNYYSGPGNYDFAVGGKYGCFGRRAGGEYDRVVGGSRRKWAQVAVFGLLTLVAELTGRSITHRLDHRVRVEPLATPMAPYYPFLLAGVRVLAALALAAVAWRLVRAHAAASAGEAFLRTVGERPVPVAEAAAEADAASLARVVRRDLALVPRPERRRAALGGPLAAVRAVAPHVLAPGLRGALGAARRGVERRPQLDRRGRALHRRHVRARMPGAPPGSRVGAPDAAVRRPRAASPVRRRVRVAAAASSRLTRGMVPPRASFSSDDPGGRGGNTARYTRTRRDGLPQRARPRDRRCSDRSPCVVGARLGDRSALPADAASSAPPGLLVARASSRRCS